MSQSHVQNQIRGRRNKSAGQTFEHWIQNSCNFYREQGWAAVEKTPEPFHILRRGKNGEVTGYYEKMAQPDFKGVLKGGQSIMFEAKHTDTDRIKQSVVNDEQTKMLDTYHELGAQCFVMVSMGLQKFYRVPWVTWKSMKELFKHKYMNEADLEKYEVQMVGPFIRLLDGITIKAE